MDVDFHTLLTKRKRETDQSIDQLNQRIINLQQYFDEQKAAILKYVDDRGEELTRLLSKLNDEFEEDRRLRIEREEVVVKQLTDHEQEVAERFQQQIVSFFSFSIIYIVYFMCCVGVKRVTLHCDQDGARGQHQTT